MNKHLTLSPMHAIEKPILNALRLPRSSRRAFQTHQFRPLTVNTCVQSSLRKDNYTHFGTFSRSKYFYNRSLAPTASSQRHARRMQSTLEVRQKDPSSNMADPVNPVDFYRQHISELVAPIVGKTPAEVYPTLQWTQTLDKGDLMLPVPALRLKGKKPAEISAEIVEKMSESDLLEKPTVSNNTFVQFFFKPAPLTKTVLSTILSEKKAYGTSPKPGLIDPNDPSKGQKFVIVEFSAPNIAKEFHAGHLRSTIIGGFIAKLYQATGFRVHRSNYLGDWGKQYGLLVNGFKKFGSQEELDKNAVGHLYDVYVKINKIKSEQDAPIKVLKDEIKAKKVNNEDVSELEKELAPLVEESEDEKARKYFKSMEDGDPEALAMWKKFRDMSIDKYKVTYSRLNIEFDDFDGEASVPKDMIQRVTTELAEKKISEDSEGAVIIDFTKHGAKKLGKAILQRKDGTPLYLTRDIAMIRHRWETHHFDKLIYVVASQQDLHLAQFFKVTEISGHREISDKCEHISFGLVKGMSTRKGTAKFLDDILRDVGDKMHEVMKKNQAKYEQVEDPEATADILGITAVMVQDMSGKRVNGYEFDLDKMTAFEGDTGPYLQYAHARLCSIERKAGVDVSQLASANFSLLSEPHAVGLVRVLSQWPDVVLNALKTQEPATVVTYLFKMTHTLSSSYEFLQVVGSEPELKQARLALYEAARQVLWNGMTLLGLSPVERM